MRFLVLSSLILAVTLSAAEIRTVAGNGAKGFSGDGGQAAQAQLNNPFGLTRGPDGALYVCDTDNHRIRKISPDGKISTVAGSGERGWTGDGGPATAAKLNEPYEVRFDSAGNMYWCERLSHTVRKMDAKTGVVTTIAGNGTLGFSGDDGPGAKAQLNQPHSIAIDSANRVYICDILNHRIRVVDPKTGTISTFSGGGQTKLADGVKVAEAKLNGPRAMDFAPDGTMWIAFREGNTIYRIDMKTGVFHHVAGKGGKPGFGGNGGPAKAATLGGPKGISIGPDGRVYFADTESHSIRCVDLKQDTVELVAGTGQRGDGPDGDPLGCKLARPHGVFVDKDGAVYIGGSEDHRVRMVK